LDRLFCQSTQFSTMLQRLVALATDVAVLIATALYVGFMVICENPLLEKYVFGYPLHKPGTTPQDHLGPEIKLWPPKRKHSLIEDETTHKMPKVVMSGTVTYEDKTPIPNAKMHIFHPDYNGRYSIFGYDCRGVIEADKNGRYEFESCVPGCLTLQGFFGIKLPAFAKHLLARPGHFHILFENASKPFITQVYTTQQYKHEDSIRNMYKLPPLEENFINLQRREADDKYDRPYFVGKFDFVLPK
jgi:protocatechuate 3,4-dioxygenase beta subunit